MPRRVSVSAAVEGLVDEAVARRLIEDAGGIPGPVYGKNGKPGLRKNIRAYNQAARWHPWLVLVDLDHEHECAPPLCERWVAAPAPHLCFRVAVRAVEAWLLADYETLARFLRVSGANLPREPEILPDPKRALIDIARRSRTRAIREDMAPRSGSGRAVGPAYTSRMIEYIQTEWRPVAAAQRSESLQRAIARLVRLIEHAPATGWGED
jgi:hypothetical protein